MSHTNLIVCPHCGGINRVPTDRAGERPSCGKCHYLLFTSKPVEVDEAGFARQLQRSDIPLLVDFWAPWCGPCRAMAPAFARAAELLEPKVRLLKVNTEQSQQLAARFGIRSIPTLALFKGGQELARTAGAMETSQLVSWTRKNL